MIANLTLKHSKLQITMYTHRKLNSYYMYINNQQLSERNQKICFLCPHETCFSSEKLYNQFSLCSIEDDAMQIYEVPERTGGWYKMT